MNTSRSDKTVLVVDDDEDFLLQQKVMLEGAGYAVVAAGGPAQALEALEGRGVDIALVDLMMEHMDDGFTLCYQLKKRHPELPVILVTGVASETGIEFDAATDEERAWVKADAMLAKPVRPEQLTRAIERLLGERA